MSFLTAGNDIGRVIRDDFGNLQIPALLAGSASKRCYSILCLTCISLACIDRMLQRTASRQWKLRLKHAGRVNNDGLLYTTTHPEPIPSCTFKRHQYETNIAARATAITQTPCFAAVVAAPELTTTLLTLGPCGAVAFIDAPTKPGSRSSPSTSTRAIPLYRGKKSVVSNRLRP